MKKIGLLTLVCIFAFTAVAFAAIGGSKARRSAPPPRQSTTQKAPLQKPPADAKQGYKPSAPASGYGDKTPAGKAAAPGAAASQAAQKASGGFLRNAGLLAGGMLLGGMFASLFGGAFDGMLATILGMAFNLILLAVIVMAARFFWNRFKKRRDEERNPWRRGGDRSTR